MRTTDLTPKQVRALTGLAEHQLRWLRLSGKVYVEREGNMYVYDAVSLYERVPEAREALDQLLAIETRTEGGTPFWLAYPAYLRLEAAGLIVIDKPVHHPTGIQYGQEYWSVRRTEQGQAIATLLNELHEEGYFL